MSDTLLQAERACLDLMARYCAHVDTRRHADLAALFAPEGELHIAGRLLRGGLEIARFFDERPASLSVHLPGAEWVDVDLVSASAQGGCSAAVYRVNGDPATLTLPQPLAAPPVLARYEDRFVKTPAGWRYACRRAVAVFVPA